MKEKTTVGKWWWADGHIAGHFNDADESPDGLTRRAECPRCVELWPAPTEASPPAEIPLEAIGAERPSSAFADSITVGAARARTQELYCRPRWLRGEPCEHGAIGGHP